MSFHLDKNISDIIINYYYSDYTFYPKENQQNDIKQEFVSKEPNISSNALSSNYKSTNLYISKKIHEIQGIDFDGELIIEHIPITNGTSKLYLCIPLKTRKGSHSPIDDIIKKQKVTTININTILSQESTGILYTSTYLPFMTPLADKVLLLTRPISVESDFRDCHKADLFELLSDEYQIVSIIPFTPFRIEDAKSNRSNPFISAPFGGVLNENWSNNGEPKSHLYNSSIKDSKSVGNWYSREPMIEGMESNLYCQPVDINDSSNNDMATITIPMGGVDNKHDTANVVLSLVQNFGVFLVVLLGLWFLVPYAYDLFLVDHINLAVSNANIAMGDKASRLSASEILISTFLLLMSISFIYSGTAGTNPSFTIIGFFFFISYIIIFLRIQYIKNFEHVGGYDAFIKSVFSGSPSNPNLDFSTITPNFYGVIIDSIKSLFSKKQFVTVCILFVGVFCTIYFTVLKNTSSSEQLIWGFIIAFLCIFIGVYAASMMPI